MPVRNVAIMEGPLYHVVTGEYHPNNSSEYKTAPDGGTLVGFTLSFNSMFKSLLTIILFLTACIKIY